MANSAVVIITLSIGLSLLGTLLAAVLPDTRGLLATAVLTSVAGAADLAAGIVLVSGHDAFTARLYRLYPFGMLTARGDATSGFFLVLIGAVLIGVGIYTWGYMNKFRGANFRPFGMMLQVMMISLLGIVLANDLILFLMAWETMAVLSYLLVAFERDDEQVARAGFLMLAMSEVGSAAFLAAFLLLGSQAHSLSFDAMRAAMPAISGSVQAAAFLLFFFGFGVKAGIVPLQVWLPVAHPAAPSNVSALLSTVIVSMGLYGIVRFAVQMMGIGPAWWGFVIAGFGALSAILGILYALMERDLKRFLAYSTIENVGIVLIGLGASMVFASSHHDILAALAMIAALFHALNHAVYKALLFCGAGAVDLGAHVRNMDQLGGLIRRMPWTAALFLIGAVSIAGVAPFAGFISEWLTLESLLQSYVLPDVGSKVGIALVGVVLALTAGLAVTAFVKAFGVSFLGMARTDAAGEAREAPRSMILGMIILAVETLALGFLPTAFIPWFARAAASTYGPNITNAVVPPTYTHPGQNALLIHLGGGLFRWIVPAQGPVVVPAISSFAAASPTLLVIVLTVGVCATGLVVWYLQRVNGARRAEVWAGGITEYTPNYQYTATSYANPIRIIFGMIYQPGRQAETQTERSPYFRMQVNYRVYVTPVFERYVYPAIIGSVRALSTGAKVFQSGSVNVYLAYIFAILVVTLIVIR